MKINSGMILTKLDDEYVAVSTGDVKSFHGIVKMNKTGADIWNFVEEGLSETQIAEKLVEKYDEVDFQTALENTKYVLDTLREKGILTD